MPPNSEIEKLERRWKDNPKGTGFAPYAEALRKQGDLELAREALRQGLEIHPDHIPGNIVLGRCCLDLAEDEPAEAAFRHVLDLDVENVIALKALAEITERQGRLAETVDWLTRLVASDPNNDEAVAHLARVEASRLAAAAAASRPLTESGAHVTVPMPEERPPAPAPAPLPEAITAVVPPPLGAPVPEPVSTVAESPAPPPEPVFTVAESPVPPPEPASEAVAEAVAEPSAAEPAVAEAHEPADMAEAPTVEMEPVVRSDEGEAVPGLLLSEISMHEAGMASLAVEGMERDEPPSLEPEETAGLNRVEGLTASGAFVTPIDRETDIDLAPSTGGEFQAPDDSLALLPTSQAGSEFQTPDAALELSASMSGGNEFQSADASAELAEALPPAATSEAEAGLELPEGGLEAPRIVEIAPEPVAAEVGPDVPAAAAPAAPAQAPETGRKTSELRLIFPDEAAEPEQPKLRRISQETPAITIPSPAEPVIREPEPVMTESMAELYARQGHHGEALRVYRVLSAQQPGEPRFHERIRELEAAQAPKARRVGVAAMETGGESVESFFRSLATARPGLMGLAAAAAERGQPEGKGAPTRPASDPLSLSAIFGEEPARTQPPPPPEPPAPQAADAFSFDQFFGKPAAEPPRPPIDSGRPSEDDLDQFQNWLKGLKR